MEKQKLNLDELKIQSFVTELDKENNKTLDLQGGVDLLIAKTVSRPCPTIFVCGTWISCPAE